ncbi:hypothetical protein GCM10023163_07110 [Aestuariibaculum suncheonense]
MFKSNVFVKNNRCKALVIIGFYDNCQVFYQGLFLNLNSLNKNDYKTFNQALQWKQQV